MANHQRSHRPLNHLFAAILAAPAVLSPAPASSASPVPLAGLGPPRIPMMSPDEQFTRQFERDRNFATSSNPPEPSVANTVAYGGPHFHEKRPAFGINLSSEKGFDIRAGGLSGRALLNKLTR